MTQPIFARRGRLTVRLFRYLYEGCQNGEPVPILITITILAVVFGYILSHFTKSKNEDGLESDHLGTTQDDFDDFERSED